MRRNLFVALVAGLLLATVSPGGAAAMEGDATQSYIVVLAPEMAGVSETVRVLGGGGEPGRHLRR